MSSPTDMSTITSISRPSTSGACLLVLSPNERYEADDETHKALSKQEERSQAIKKIKAFLATPKEYDLRLRLGHGLIYSEKLHELLDRARARYYVDLDTLVVRAMVRSVHESLPKFAVECYVRMCKAIFTSEESEHVSLDTDDVQLYSKIGGYDKKPQAYEKIPDQSYVMEDPQIQKVFRTVIFESAFSETYDDLLRDMQQWLLNSDGKVQLVVLANIKEDKKTLATQQKSDAFRDRAARLLMDIGNDLGRVTHADILEWSTEQESQATKIYNSQGYIDGIHTYLQTQVQSNDWVGPITADLEFWELLGSEPQRRGEIVHVFPGPIVGELPPLYIGDVIHPDCRSSFSNFDASRKLILDPTHFVKPLTRGIRQLGISRAYKFAHSKDRSEKYEDYKE